MDLGDRGVGTRIDFSFTTTDSTGAAAALTGGSLGCSKQGQMTTFAPAGLVLSVGTGAYAGLNVVTVFTGSSSSFFSAGNDFSILLLAGTVSAVSQANCAFATFSLENRVVNWRQVVGPTTAVNLTQTTIGGVTAPVIVNWGLTVNPTASVNFTNTTVGGVTAPVVPNWGAIVNPTSSVSLTGTTIGGVTAPVIVNWGLTVNPTASVNFTNTTIGGVTAPVIPNWGAMVNPTASISLTNTTVGGVIAPVRPNWGDVVNPGSTVSLSGTTVANVTTTATASSVTSIGANGIGAASIDPTADAEIADYILGRNVAGGANGGRTVSYAMQRLTNRVGVVLSTGTVYQTDDSTTLYNFFITTTTAMSVTQIDPS